MTRTNRFDQPIGRPLGDWTAPDFPNHVPLAGDRVRLEPLSWEQHGQAISEEFLSAPDSHWTYMSFGPFANVDELELVIRDMGAHDDRLPYAIVVDGDALGVASFMRIDQVNGVLEVGSIVLGPGLQRTTGATEALFVMIRHAFELGYRRCEWKCDDLNAPSRSAAARLGFTYEGTFKKATHYKGRNRDTSWYAITIDEWPKREKALSAWLEPSNFDEQGNQRRSLGEMRESI